MRELWEAPRRYRQPARCRMAATPEKTGTAIVGAGARHQRETTEMCPVQRDRSCQGYRASSQPRLEPHPLALAKVQGRSWVVFDGSSTRQWRGALQYQGVWAPKKELESGPVPRRCRGHLGRRAYAPVEVHPQGLHYLASGMRWIPSRRLISWRLPFLLRHLRIELPTLAPLRQLWSTREKPAGKRACSLAERAVLPGHCRERLPRPFQARNEAK